MCATKNGALNNAEVVEDQRGSGDTKGSFNWERILRKFSEGHKVECKFLPTEIPLAERSLKLFPTGSSYQGTWNVLGMSGYGVYTFPNGVKYEGGFDDGEFHGEGKLKYPDGSILVGKWKHGVMYDMKLIFADGLEYDENDWAYCKMPDRRFTIEHDEGLNPAGESYKTATQPTPDIPLGMYDTGDGVYNPESKMVHYYDDTSKVIRVPVEREQKWIEKNCRYNPITPLGAQPELYEDWQPPLYKKIDSHANIVTQSNAEFYFSSSSSDEESFVSDELSGEADCTSANENTII